MSTNHHARPSHYITTPNHRRNMGLLYGLTSAGTILVCVMVMLGNIGGLDDCLAVQSKDTCLYSMR